MKGRAAQMNKIVQGTTPTVRFRNGETTSDPPQTLNVNNPRIELDES